MKREPPISERARDLRLPGIVHDLNNVFQTLMDAAELLSTDEERAYLSKAILRSVERGRNLVAGIESVDGQTASFESILHGAISFVEDSLLAGGPRIAFQCSVEGGIELRRNWAWERVLINLFSNAVRAMPKGGTIHVTAGREGSLAEILVRDEGVGIASEILPVVFEPGVSTRGSGLGLHIVATIVQQDGGEVKARNRADGAGAEFWIRVPCLVERADTVLAAHA